jgi:hypothetical protein
MQFKLTATNAYSFTLITKHFKIRILKSKIIFYKKPLQIDTNKNPVYIMNCSQGYCVL